MKTIKIYTLLFVLLLAIFYPSRSFGNVPNYQGKVILVVDQTIATNVTVVTNLNRLTSDLVGDGWRVLVLNVPRGLSPEESGWVQTNGPEVRQIRALIQADYNAATNDVQEVILIGHVPVPYSGFNAEIVGGHYSAAEPADTFYGEMVAKYWVGGWADDATNIATGPGPSNFPADGIFDPTDMPLPMELGVGRLDLYGMPSFGVDEAALIAQYLNKDHDFRWENFVSTRSAYVTQQEGKFYINDLPLDDIFENANVYTNVNGGVFSWFPDVGSTNYLIGYGGGGGYSDYASADGIGGTDPMEITEDRSPCVSNNFVEYNSRVVFVSLCGSYFGDWDQTNDFLRAPLANPYDPANGQLGYGLTASWCWENSGENPIDNFALDENSLTNRAMGATVGQALFAGYDNDVNHALMGDPTLRMYAVLPPENLNVLGSSNSVVLTWGASSDPGLIGYNIYGAPTSNGPFSLLNTNGLVTSLSFDTTRLTSGTPNNFYMVRAVKQEITPVGSYTNMSEGVQANASNGIPYLTIISAPVDSMVFANTEGYTNNAAAFTVDAVGIDDAGDEQLNYQWYENGVALTDGANIQGSRTRALLIKEVQTNDAGSFYVVISLADNSRIITNSTVSLQVVSANPIATADYFTVIRNTPANLEVLTNDISFFPSPTMRLISISSLSNPDAGVITINSNSTAVYFIPSIAFLGTVTFTYIMTDGVSFAQATATITVVPNLNDTPPVISSIGSQQMTQGQILILSIPFTVNDLYTAPDNLLYTVDSSSNAVIYIGITENGTNWALQLASSTQFYGNSTITLHVIDQDLKSSSLSFQVNVTQNTSLPAFVSTQITSTGFTFGVNGVPNSKWDVYSSSDLTNWTLVGGMTLNSAGTNLFNDSGVAGVSDRFYRLSNASFCSSAVGFVRLIVDPGSDLIANQLDASTNDTLNSVFAQTSLPSGTIVQKVIASTGAFIYYTNSAGMWLPNGNATLNPGEGAFVENLTSNAFMVSFVGLVREGNLAATMRSGGYYSSQLPLTGGLQTALGYIPNLGDTVEIWNQTDPGWSSYDYNSHNGNPPAWIPSEPIMAVGEAFYFTSSTNNVWTQNYSACGGQTICSSPVLTNSIISSNDFSFGIIGPAGTYWDVYSSPDLTNWTQVGGVTLSAAGTNSYTDNTISGASDRFYKLSNGSCCSSAIGFERLTAVPGYTLIADQLDARTNTLNGLFQPAMPDGTTLPSGTVIEKWNGSAYNYYTNSAGMWLPNGNATLNPGEGAFVENLTSNVFTVTFVGLVREGNLAATMQSGGFYSSQLPLTGGLQTALGYVPNLGDTVEIWNQTDQNWSVYGYNSHKGNPPAWIPSEPIMAVGEAFYFTSSTNNIWTQNYSACGGQTICSSPVLTNSIISSNDFSFGIIGPAGTYWDVYSSPDLTNWTQVGGVTLSAAGTNSYTDNTISGASDRFYKLSNGSCCSSAIGFERLTAVPGYTLIADQLDARTNTLNGLFQPAMPDGTTLPSGTVIEKWNGSAYNYYTNSAGMWLPNGNATLNPGEGAFVENLTSNVFTVTFVGLVREGNLAATMQSGGFYSSQLPLTGGLQTALGYVPNLGDTVEIWNQTDQNWSVYGYNSHKGNPPAWIPSEPIMAVGEAFYFTSSTNNIWTQNYSACH